ncbi:hypothetical protein D9M68_770570 [compost metagenome]
MFSRTDSSATMPSVLRSSGHSARPSRIASAGFEKLTERPSIFSTPRSGDSRPNSRRASSVRPAPSRPAMPTTSPARTRRSVACNCPAWPNPSDCRSAGAASSNAGSAAGRADCAANSRPSIAAISACGPRSAAFHSPTQLPLRSTVMRSDTAYIWFRKCVTKTMARPSPRSRRSTSNSFSTSSSSRLDVGSSRISTFDDTPSARAIATICCTATE